MPKKSLEPCLTQLPLVLFVVPVNARICCRLWAKRERNACRHPHPDSSQRWIENQPARAAPILTMVRDTFGGYTLEGPFEGDWVADDGRVYEESNYRLEVLVPSNRVQEARDVFSRIGKQLGQRSDLL